LAVCDPDEELFVVVEVGTLWETGGWDEDFVEEMGAYCFVLVREREWGMGIRGGKEGVKILRRPCGVAEEIRPRRTSCLKGLKTINLNSTMLPPSSAPFYSLSTRTSK
jgi:hypothetical protein